VPLEQERQDAEGLVLELEHQAFLAQGRKTFRS
jgi:hypothetical protein